MHDTFHAKVRGMIQRGRANEWLKFDTTMQAYIRVGQRVRQSNGERIQCITLANLQCGVPRKGTFTALVKELQVYRLPIVLENVLDRSWQAVLMERHGWKLFVERESYAADDLILEVEQYENTAQETQPASEGKAEADHT